MINLITMPACRSAAFRHAGMILPEILLSLAKKMELFFHAISILIPGFIVFERRL